MEKIEEIVRVHFGRSRTIRLDVKAWQKKMRRWKRLKGKILDLLANSAQTPEEIKAWFDTPHPKLRNRPPKDLFNPDCVAVLYPAVRRQFDRYVRLG